MFEFFQSDIALQFRYKNCTFVWIATHA